MQKLYLVLALLLSSCSYESSFQEPDNIIPQWIKNHMELEAKEPLQIVDGPSSYVLLKFKEAL